MKNSKLRKQLTAISKTEQKETEEIEILSAQYESHLFGGSCPTLTACTDFTSCDRKYVTRSEITCTGLVCCGKKYRIRN